MRMRNLGPMFKRGRATMQVKCEYANHTENWRFNVFFFLKVLLQCEQFSFVVSRCYQNVNAKSILEHFAFTVTWVLTLKNSRLRRRKLLATPPS